MDLVPPLEISVSAIAGIALFLLYVDKLAFGLASQTSYKAVKNEISHRASVMLRDARRFLILRTDLNFRKWRWFDRPGCRAVFWWS